MKITAVIGQEKQKANPRPTIIPEQPSIRAAVSSTTIVPSEDT